MKTTNDPVTMWNGSQRKTASCNKEFEDLVVSCIGDERKSITCSENEVPLDNIVSIRCRRHKKRFNVEKSWLKTSEWLCPKCYEKLSPSERLYYAPSSDKVDVRPAEQGKPIVYEEYNSNQKSQKIVDSTGETRCNDIQLSKDAIEAKYPIDKETKSKVESKKGRKHSFAQQTIFCDQKSPVEDDVSSMFSPTIAALLPSWRMKCKKCGKSVPVHKTYIDNNSSVLCPECFSQMTPSEVKEFSTRNPSSTAELWQVDQSFSRPRSSVLKPIPNVTPTCAVYRQPLVTDGGSSDVALGGCYSNSRIFSMTIQELAEAVHKGKISKARAKIEIGRRRKSKYFDSLPEVEPVSPILPY